MASKPSIPSWQRAQAPAPTPTEADTRPSPEPQSAEETAASAPGTEESTRDVTEETTPDDASLLDQASRFLDDPTIRDAPRAKKVEFLESKGVTAEDIEKLLRRERSEDLSSDITEAGERAWSSKPTPRTASAPPPQPQPQPQPRDIPPIVTYPEFLAQPTQQPPLITTRRLINTAYITGGLIATVYGLSKYIVGPMTQNLTESRHDFASHTQEQLDKLNERLRDTASVDPATKAKTSASGMADDISEPDSDPTELYHRDFGTQTTPNLSRRDSKSSSTEEDEGLVKAHENRLKILTLHLRELEATRSNDAASSESLKTQLSDLETYLSDMSYQNQYYSNAGLYGGTYGLPKGRDGKDDQIEVLKSDIRAVKGVFLSARNFPAGGRNSAPLRAGGSTPQHLNYPNTMEAFASKLPFGHSRSKSQDPDEDTSITTLLTADQCADLTFLIATITAAMRKSLLDTFEPEETPPDAEPAKSEEAALAAAPSDVENADVEKEDKARKLKEQLKKDRVKRQEDAKKELAKPEVQELKKEMLRYFDEWRGRVVGRVGEVVNSREEARHQTKEVKDSDVKRTFRRSDTGTKSLGGLDDKGEDEDAAFKELYPPVDTVLTHLDQDKRALVLHSLVLILLSLETYSAHSRILLLYLTSSLHLKLSIMKNDEETVSRGLLEAASKQLNADAETKKAAESSSTARKWKVGLAGVAGAALIGVTGGLAAPLLAAGIGSVMGGLGLGATAAAGYLGTLASSSVLVGGLFGAYGAKMTSKAMDDYAREVEDFGFIPIHNFHRPRKLEKEFRRLRVAIAISGWLTRKEDVVVPWRYLEPGIEGFALRWELESLLKLGNSMEGFVKSAAWSYAKTQIIKRTVFGALTAGLWPLGLLKISSILDNPFSVAKFRGDRAGEVLADALINRVQGERPVTLIGYSLGARLIFSCLQTLAKRKAFGLIENVVFLGAPCPSDTEDWRSIRSVVSGRVINVFSTNDYILAFLYRTSSVQLGVAGLQPVLGVHGVQNVDVSAMVNGHTQYRYLTGSILKKVGFEDIDVAEVEQEESEMRAVEEMEKKARDEKEGKVTSEDEEKAQLEKDIEKKNEESIMDWMMAKMNVGTLWSSGSQEKTEAEQMVALEKKAQEKEEVGKNP
ncbi:DUF726-domain-containing protein [Bimuria novae-zelandiae CBS 107.79]|uniref:DUF726-domain-containing protein n=1 Tax=Bimuria novae-zelandiae CBS 107.79 TaxID=1447943 RepID=A0A6A5UNE2_9PLEO|nr:DUF726-domain-containing protein [Bimuria novae-zelandiae CBS 107.79]